MTTALSLPAPYVDHLTRPRNRGDLEPADATGEAGTPLVGAGVRLTLRFRLTAVASLSCFIGAAGS